MFSYLLSFQIGIETYSEFSMGLSLNSMCDVWFIDVLLPVSELTSAKHSILAVWTAERQLVVRLVTRRFVKGNWSSLAGSSTAYLPSSEKSIISQVSFRLGERFQNVKS